MNIDSFKWLNESESTVEGDKITIFAPQQTDFFNNPVAENGRLQEPIGNAPFLYTDIEGDFIIRVFVCPEFIDDYDAACLMIHQNDHTWAKLAFEKSDFDTTAIVSVVTNQTSDDANGCNIKTDSVWLQMARAGNVIVLHYSLDGEKYDMVRICSLPLESVSKIGILAQSPIGDGANHMFSNLTIEKRTITNLRKGI